jgi:hypothetical protein
VDDAMRVHVLQAGSSTTKHLKASQPVKVELGAVRQRAAQLVARLLFFEARAYFPCLQGQNSVGNDNASQYTVWQPTKICCSLTPPLPSALARSKQQHRCMDYNCWAERNCQVGLIGECLSTDVCNVWDPWLKLPSCTNMPTRFKARCSRNDDLFRMDIVTCGPMCREQRVTEKVPLREHTVATILRESTVQR